MSIEENTYVPFFFFILAPPLMLEKKIRQIFFLR